MEEPVTLSPEQNALAMSEKDITVSAVNVEVPAGSVEQRKPESGTEVPLGDKSAPEGFKFEYDPLWKKFEADGIEIPPDFKKGNFGEGMKEWDAIIQTIIENVDLGQEEDDAFMQQYKQVPPDRRGEFLNTYTQRNEFYSLPATDGISAWYSGQKNDKGEPKYTEEQIKQYVDGKSPIELDNEWEGIKSYAEQLETKKSQETIQGMQKERVKQIETLNKERVSKAETAWKDIETLKDLSGIPLTPEVLTDSKAQYLKLTQINPKTGSPYLLDALSDDKVLAKTILAMSLIEGDYVRNYLSTYKEDFKDEVFQKLDINVKPKSGSGSSFKVAQDPKEMV